MGIEVQICIVMQMFICAGDPFILPALLDALFGNGMMMNPPRLIMRKNPVVHNRGNVRYVGNEVKFLNIL